MSLVIITLTSIQTKLRRNSVKFKHPINVVAKYDDILKANPQTPPPAWPGTDRAKLRFNWLMPPPGKGSGGHMNIYRFIEYLEKAGHACHIYLYTQVEHGPISGVQAAMGDSYPTLNAPMDWLEDNTIMEPADGLFSTSWETAYPSFNSSLVAKRFYFVQDFEPYFYPVGSLSVLAENTYKFGFFGITAGGWLANKLHADYGMKTDHFDFAANKALYNYVNDQPRREILCYVRPFTERRGFEVALMALDLFHQKHPDYKINLAGWDVSDYTIPFPHTNLKTLELHQLNELYNRCAAGLVLSLTNMSLLPLELLGSGTIPVVNDGENNRLVSDNKFIAYSGNSPYELADTLSRTISQQDLPARAKEASDSVTGTGWDKSGKKFVEVIERETRRS